MYGFVINDAVNNVDIYGLWKLKFALDKTYKFPKGNERGFLSFSTRVDIESGNGSAVFNGSLGLRFFFSEMIPGLQAGVGTIAGVILEHVGMHQEVRVGGSVSGKIDCSCPDEATGIHCEVVKLNARLQAQGRLGYEGDDARLIGSVTGGGNYNCLFRKICG